VVKLVIAEPEHLEWVVDVAFALGGFWGPNLLPVDERVVSKCTAVWLEDSCGGGQRYGESKEQLLLHDCFPPPVVEGSNLSFVVAIKI
jgi:hypothetical protein